MMLQFAASVLKDMLKVLTLPVRSSIGYIEATFRNLFHVRRLR